jgi:hypothetical protein
MPPGELFHRAVHGRLGDRLEFLDEPTLEPGQRFVAGSQDTGVFEQTSQMVGRDVGTGFVEALMGQRDLPTGQPCQQFLDSGRTLPGQDAGGPLNAAQCLNDGNHGVWVVRAVDHRHGEIGAKGTTGTGSAAVENAFGTATSTSEVCGNPRARQTDRLPICVDGQAGKHPVVAASGADTTSAHRRVKTAVAQVLTGPGRSSLVGHPLTPAAAELPAGNPRAAPFG